MITLKKITLINFLSHKNTVVNFNDGQKILIDGRSGAGKSSLCDAITWSLYGRARADNKSLIMDGATTATVSIVLSDKDKNIEYKIERKISKGNKHELVIYEKNGDDKTFKLSKVSGIKESQEYIEKQILHASYLLFINSIVHIQSSTENFVSQTALRKKEILLEIINASDYDEYLKKAKNELQLKKIDLSSATAKKEEREKSIEHDRINASKIQIYKDNAKKLKEQKEITQKEYDKLFEQKNKNEVDIALLSDKESKIIEIIKDIDLVNAEMKTLNAKKDELYKININEIETKISELETKQKELKELESRQQEYFEWKQKVNELITSAPADRDYDAEIEKINKQIIAVMGEEVELCPNCSTPYPKMAQNRSQRVETLEHDLSIAQADKESLEDSRKTYSDKLAALGNMDVVDTTKIAKLRSEIALLEPYKAQAIRFEGKRAIIDGFNNSIDALTKKGNTLFTQKSDMEKEIIGKDSLIKKQKEIVEEIQILITKLQQITSEEHENSGYLMIAEEAEKNIKLNESVLDKLKVELKCVEDDIESLELVKGAFNQNGIRAIVIDSIIPQLEDRINNILGKLSEFTIKLETQKSGAGKDVVLEGLFIDIINPHGKQLDFSLFSGGEKIKISFAINEAMAEISKINFRVIDETILSLDNESTEQFLEAMAEIQQKVSQVICISHIDEIKEMFEEKLLITKINGVSHTS